jgi:hypothetical protein
MTWSQSVLTISRTQILDVNDPAGIPRISAPTCSRSWRSGQQRLWQDTSAACSSTVQKVQFKSLISSGARVICQHILYEPSARGWFVILDQLSTIAQQLHLISFSFFRPGETGTTYVAEMITANLPFVRRGDRQRDKSRARRPVRVLAFTMLYISMFVLLALSRGFTIGGGAAARGSAGMCSTCLLLMQCVIGVRNTYWSLNNL